MRLVLPLLLLTAPALAQDLDFGGPATQTASFAETGGTALIASGPFAEGKVPGTLREGVVEQTAWRIDTPATTLDLARRLQSQLEAAGWDIGFSCETRACGGFDFRFALPLITEPDMHVDLGDFRYLTAEQADMALSLIISRAQKTAFVQVTRVSGSALPAMAPAVTPPMVAPPVAPASQGDLAQRLQSAGSVVLEGLIFASGKGALETGDAPVLRDLADWMAAQPEARIALVGHTDASGSLPGNIALSEARAQAVRKVLISLGVAANRIEAKGVGYLAPRASNLTPEGRMQNRRVEVMITSTQVIAAP